MRRIVLLLPLLLTCFVGLAQEKLFNEAINRGLTSNGCYCVENAKMKNVTLDEMMSYAKSKGYIIGKTTQKSHVRFGDSKLLVEKMEFIDSKNYPTYVFHALADKGFDFNRLKAKGAFYEPQEDKVYEKTQVAGVSALSGKRTRFIRHEQALWTGSVSSGLIEGTGIGFVAMPNGMYTRFEGTFAKGFPASEIKVKFVTKTDMNNAAVKDDELKTSRYPAISRRAFAQIVGTTDAKLKQALNLRLEGLYKEDIAKLETIYNKAKTITVSNYSNATQDDFVVEFITLYQKAKYDPNGALPKAMELNDVFYVIDALKMKFLDHYYGYSLWSLLTMFYDWLDDAEKSHRELLSTGLEKARNGKTNSKYGFKNFFSQAADQLSRKKTQFENKISSDIAEYNRMVASEKEDRRKTQEKLSKEIDWERSKDPSGKLTSGLFDAYWYYEKNGNIYFKAGSNNVEYNVHYYDRKGERFVGFYIVYCSDKIRRNLGDKSYSYFKTKKEMIDAILKAAQ